MAYAFISCEENILHIFDLRCHLEIIFPTKTTYSEWVVRFRERWNLKLSGLEPLTKGNLFTSHEPPSF